MGNEGGTIIYYEMKSGQTKNREKYSNTLPRKYLHLSRRNLSTIPVLRYCHHYSTILLSPRMTIFLFIFTFAVTIVIKMLFSVIFPSQGAVFIDNCFSALIISAVCLTINQQNPFCWICIGPINDCLHLDALSLTLI